MAIAEQMRLWRPAQQAVVSLADELGIGQDPLIGYAPYSAPPTPGPYTVTAQSGRIIDPLGRAALPDT